MPLISVSIVCGVKLFGIVSCDGSGNLLNVYESVCEGTLSSSGELFSLDPKYVGSKVSALVGSSPGG